MNQPDNTEALSKARVKDMFEASGYPLSYERGESVMRFDAEEPTVFILCSGTAALQVVDKEQASELNVTHLLPGDVFGCVSRDSSDSNQIEMYVLAKSACVVLALTAQQLETAGAHDPAAVFALFSELSRTNLRSMRKVGQFAFFDVRGRVSSALIELCKLPDAVSQPDGILLSNTRVEIASMVGCTREMVGKVLKGLCKQKLISFHGRKMLVHVESNH